MGFVLCVARQNYVAKMAELRAKLEGNYIQKK